MEFKGTKGEWRVKHDTTHIECNDEIISIGGYLRVYDDTQLENELWLDMRARTEIDRIIIQKERDANAKLIAAAPDLLEALQDCISNIEWLVKYSNVEPHFLETFYNVSTNSIAISQEAINKALN